MAYRVLSLLVAIVLGLRAVEDWFPMTALFPHLAPGTRTLATPRPIVLGLRAVEDWFAMAALFPHLAPGTRTLAPLYSDGLARLAERFAGT